VGRAKPGWSAGRAGRAPARPAPAPGWSDECWSQPPGPAAGTSTHHRDPGAARLDRAPHPDPAPRAAAGLAGPADRPAGALRTQATGRAGARRHQEARAPARRRGVAGARPRQSARPAGEAAAHRRRAGRHRLVHSAVDDHSRLANSEVLPDEQGSTASAFWAGAQVFHAAHGIRAQRAFTDNGSCYRSRAWREQLAAAGVAHKRTRPYHPQTNWSLSDRPAPVGVGGPPGGRCTGRAGRRRRARRARRRWNR
jgi:hypothetical protein